MAIKMPPGLPMFLLEHLSSGLALILTLFPPDAYSGKQKETEPSTHVGELD